MNNENKTLVDEVYNKYFKYNASLPPFVNPYCLVNFKDMFHDFKVVGAEYWVMQGMPRFLIKQAINRNDGFRINCEADRVSFLCEMRRAHASYLPGVIGHINRMVEVKVFQAGNIQSMSSFLNLINVESQKFTGDSRMRGCYVIMPNPPGDVYLDETHMYVNCGNATYDEILEYINPIIKRHGVYANVEYLRLYVSDEEFVWVESYFDESVWDDVYSQRKNENRE